MILETNVKGLAVWKVLAAAMLAVGCGAARAAEPWEDPAVNAIPSLPVENSKIVFSTKPACVFRLRAS